jgi:hypothetical protein
MLSRVASHCWSDLANYISSAYPPIIGVVDQRDECGGLVLELDKLKGQALDPHTPWHPHRNGGMFLCDYVSRKE